MSPLRVGEADPVDRTCFAGYSVQDPSNPEEVLAVEDAGEVVVVEEEEERRKIA